MAEPHDHDPDIVLCWGYALMADLAVNVGVRVFAIFAKIASCHGLQADGSVVAACGRFDGVCCHKNHTVLAPSLN